MIHFSRHLRPYLLLSGLALLAASFPPGPVTAQQPPILTALPPYLPEAPVKGEVALAGSSTMNQLVNLWADGLKQIHPEAKLTIRMIGSEEVLSLLNEKKADIGLMSRPLTKQEADQYVPLAVATDVVGVVVHPDNPIAHLSMDQITAILTRPEANGAKTWGDLGLQGEWADLPLKLYGRSDRSGIHTHLVENFVGDAKKLRNGEICDSYAQLCREVARERGAIGYVSMSWAPPGVAKTIGIVDRQGRLHEAPRFDGTVDPAYPLVRNLFVVLPRDSASEHSPLIRELLHYALSRQGQEDTVKAGLVPLRRDQVLAARDQLGWTGTR